MNGLVFTQAPIPVLTQERCVLVGQYIVDNECTIRECAKHFGIGKTTVYRDICKLQYMARPLYREVRKVLDKNANERASRGGNSRWGRRLVN